ncbi:unnamed protein product [Lymnaea stagnalis]|uniref:FAD dependent oxidoreductase domain-containing protein n=1 Tax=Lymnaea stagnalis TaxID=6523 RepID=A0AAV2H2L0_LYMST
MQHIFRSTHRYYSPIVLDTMAKVGVVGAGVLGLSSALNIQKMIPNAKITIVADKFDKDTTSHGAGGYFRPYMNDYVEEDKRMVEQWCRDSWEYYSSLAHSSDAYESGQRMVSGTVVYNTPQDQPYSLLASLSSDFHQVNNDYLKRMNLNYKYGYNFTTVVTQPPKFLTWIMSQFKENGGSVEKRTVQKLTELIGEFDVVINCCGLGARELVNDNDIVPVRGQLVMVHAPWIRHFFLSEDDVYFIPHDDKLIIGGTRERGNHSLTPDPAIRDKILSRALGLFPQLKGAKVVEEWVGLRPSRKKIRFEQEILQDIQGRKLPVLHNYGHGGHGISLGWGSGLHAAKIVKDILKFDKI